MVNDFSGPRGSLPLAPLPEAVKVEGKPPAMLPYPMEEEIKLAYVVYHSTQLQFMVSIIESFPRIYADRGGC